MPHDLGPGSGSGPRRRPPGRRGRPLDRSRDAAIQEAALQLLGEVGYAALTMDDVAVTAGVSKATIYRRWPTKGDLLVSVVETASDDSLVLPDTGFLRDDLVILMRALADVLSGAGGRASRVLLGAATDAPALAEAFRRGPQDRWSLAFRTVFARAVARGDVKPTAGTSLGAEGGPGILLLRWLVTGAAIDHELAEAVVDCVMMPLLRDGLS